MTCSAVFFLQEINNITCVQVLPELVLPVPGPVLVARSPPPGSSSLVPQPAGDLQEPAFPALGGLGELVGGQQVFPA